MGKIKTIGAIATMMVVLYAGNLAFCMSQVGEEHKKRRNSFEFVQKLQNLREISLYTEFLALDKQEEYSMFTEQGRKYFEEKLQGLETENIELSKKLGLYEKNVEKWLKRAINPKNYIF